MSGLVKLDPLIKNSITTGTMIAAKLPTKLKTPPVSPMSLTGAIVETSGQVIEAKPLPKNAHVKEAVTYNGLFAWLAPAMEIESKSLQRGKQEGQTIAVTC
jgi:hypothetical protein